jgi:acetolactate synthase I/II/III large subunit
MTKTGTLRSGGQLVVDTLVAYGVDRVYCVPGESYLTVLDALHDAPGIETITCRQEGGAAMMAEADGKLTGRPGICMVTRGPGATNASAGLHVAHQDSTPMVLFIGQVDRGAMERGAFQEIDYRRMFGEVAKWVAQIDRADRVQEMVARAFAVATSGRPGPVVLALPEDMLDDVATAAELTPPRRLETYPSGEQMTEVAAGLRSAERPLVILGGTGWDQETCTAIRKFAEESGVPVAASFRRQDLFDNDHPNFIGDVGVGLNPKLRQRIEQCDLLLVIGSRLGEMVTGGYSMIAIPQPKQAMIHVLSGPEELGRVYQPALAINATPRGFAKGLEAISVKPKDSWRDWLSAGRAEYEAWQKPAAIPGSVQMGPIIHWLRAHLPDDAIITNGAGNFSVWIHRFFRFRTFGTQLAPTSGSMGYGYPAAVAAKIRHPDRAVVCVAGDGDFMMTGQELATAVQYGAGVIVILVDNGMYGTIRMHQERNFPARTVATDLKNPDFAILARAYGAHGETVERTEDFAPAFERAFASGLPAIIHVKIAQEAITPSQSISQIRAAALEKA